LGINRVASLCVGGGDVRFFLLYYIAAGISVTTQRTGGNISSGQMNIFGEFS
jgi:hypothetical protein